MVGAPVSGLQPVCAWWQLHRLPRAREEPAKGAPKPHLPHLFLVIFSSLPPPLNSGVSRLLKRAKMGGKLSHETTILIRDGLGQVRVKAMATGKSANFYEPYTSI